MSSLLCIIGRPDRSGQQQEEEEPTPYRPPLSTRRLVKHNGVEIMVRGHSALRFPTSPSPPTEGPEGDGTSSSSSSSPTALYRHKYPTDEPVLRSPRCTDRLVPHHSAVATPTTVQEESTVVVEQFGQRIKLTQSKPVVVMTTKRPVLPPTPRTPPRKAKPFWRISRDSPSGTHFSSSSGEEEDPQSSDDDDDSEEEDEEEDDYSSDDESFLPPTIIRVLSKVPPREVGVEAAVVPGSAAPSSRRLRFLRSPKSGIRSSHVASLPTHRTVSTLSQVTEDEEDEEDSVRASATTNLFSNRRMVAL